VIWPEHHNRVYGHIAHNGQRKENKAMTNDTNIRAALRELRQGAVDIDTLLDAMGAPSELESLSWAARERGDVVAGRMADELARRGEWGEA
jgi:hypothetical protein